MGRVLSFALLLVALLLSACNLSSNPERQLELTELPTSTGSLTRTPLATGAVPTTLPLTPISVLPTSQPLRVPTTVALPPTIAAFYPTVTPLPISIVILSPIPGNVVAGNIQVLGAAIHPQFLQYQLEFGPDPNPGNLWYPATGIVQSPILNGLLGIWNTTSVQDGIYQLRLRVTLRDGSNLATVVNNIRVQNQAPTPVPSNTPNIPRPIAAFTQDRAVGQAPLVVKFTNQSSGNITGYSWSFGDGGSSPQANPTYTFRNPGLYTVTLNVYGPGGTSNVSRQINVQSATAPVAAFTQDKTSGPSPLSVKFTSQSTGQITAYSWIFGDGQTSTEQNPTHQFVAVGTYNVILTVTGPGGTSSVTRKITVEDPVIPPPKAAFQTDKNSGDAPLAVQFINQSTGQITNYTWDFGDNETSVDMNPAHTYAQPGTYTVTLTTIGPGGQTKAQAQITVTKKPDAPVAAFTPSATSGTAPFPVTFTNQSTGQINTYAWEFGDGQTSADQSPSHTYAQPGTYTVTLTVTGPGGTSNAKATLTATQPIQPPKAAFTQNQNSGPAPLTVQFTNQSTGESLTYNWDFGDGSPAGTEANPQHTFANPGNYTVTLTVSNAGGKDSVQAPITVSAPATATTAPPTPPTDTAVPPTATVVAVVPTDTPVPATATTAAVPPVASFTASATTGDAPLTVQFTNTSTGDVTTFAWNFGDNTPVDTNPNPSHTFAQPGTFNVTLTVAGPGGQQTSNPTTITVNAPATATTAAVPPIASFTASATTGDAPLTVQFTNTSTGDVTSFAWNFGDNTPVDTNPNPSHTFAQPGTFNVTLTVAGPGGQQTSNPTAITVNAPATATTAAVPPVASFTASATTGDAPLTVQFTNTSTGDVTSFAWNFGDNTPVDTNPNPSHTFAQPGTFNVTLTVAGPGGQQTSNPTAITVNAPATPTEVASEVPPTATQALPPISKPVVFVSNRDNQNALYQLNPDGAITKLADIGPKDKNFDLSPDGSKFVYVSDVNGHNEIFVMSADGQNKQQLTNNQVNNVEPVWSPDGTQIAFTSNVSGTDDVFVMGADGSNPTNLTNNPAVDQNPAWSKSGRIAFATNRDGNNEIYVMNRDGSNPTRLTNTQEWESSPAWSHDETKIVYVLDTNGHRQIVVSGADGSNPQQITQDASNSTNPVWSPDNSQIAFVSDRDGNSEIYTMNPDGSSAANVTSNPASDTNPIWKAQ
jgi:PKD repeat protein